jgi:hypothetical protein
VGVRIAIGPFRNRHGSLCLSYGTDEAAKHPVPDGKYVKAQRVHKSVPRIIE